MLFLTFPSAKPIRREDPAQLRQDYLDSTHPQDWEPHQNLANYARLTRWERVASWLLLCCTLKAVLGLWVVLVRWIWGEL